MAAASRALRLHDVADAEALAASIVYGSGLELSYHDAEDLHAYLVATAWQLSLVYEPGGISFSSWAGTTLRRRLVDWQRQRFGRTRWQFAGRSYERARPQLVSLDDPEHDRLGDDLTARGGDPEADCDSGLGGLYAARDRARAADYETLGLRPPRRAA